MRIALSLLILGLLPACASINSVSITPVPANRSNAVSAESERWIILGFNFDNDYADQVAKDLGGKCPSGKISGILTKDESYMYFLFFVMKRRVVATGYCERKASVAAAATPHRGKNRKYNSVDESAPESASPATEAPAAAEGEVQ